MIDELVLIDTLKKELEKAKQDYHDNDEDVFSGAICSALETVIKAVREIPKLGANEIKEEINKKFGCCHYIDTDSVVDEV